MNYLGVHNSWEGMSCDVMIKNTDKSIFVNLESVIPASIRDYFQIRSMNPGEKVYITIIHNDVHYKAYIKMDKSTSKRTILKWYRELSDIICNYFPDYEQYFEYAKKEYGPIMRFVKIDAVTYKMDFIIEDHQYCSMNKIDYTKREVLKRHGVECKICGFDFGKMYGRQGQGYIQVHNINKNTNNQIENLIPICANCNSIINRNSEQILTIKEIKDIINKNYDEKK